MPEKSNEQPKLSGQVDDTQIAEWKAKHPRGIFSVTAKDKVAYFRNPTRDEMKSTATMGKHDPIGMVETLMNDAYLGGDKALVDDDTYFYDAADAFKEILSFQTGELKKL